MSQIQFKDVAHLYLGCNYVTKDWKLYGKITHHLLDDTRIPIDAIKPILRPFPSDMTEEDEEATGLNATYRFGHHTLSPDEFVYFLKHGFDLFDLIKSGQAIDKVNTKFLKINTRK